METTWVEEMEAYKQQNLRNSFREQLLAEESNFCNNKNRNVLEQTVYMAARSYGKTMTSNYYKGTDSAKDKENPFIWDTMDIQKISKEARLETLKETKITI